MDDYIDDNIDNDKDLVADIQKHIKQLDSFLEKQTENSSKNENNLPTLDDILRDMPTFGSPTIEDYISDLKESLFTGNKSNKMKPFITTVHTDYGIFEVDTNQNEKDVNRDVYTIVNGDVKVEHDYKLLITSIQNAIKLLIHDISDDDCKTLSDNVIHFSSRTEIGSIVYQLLEAIKPDEQVGVITAVQDINEPIKIEIKNGFFNNKWKIILVISCSFLYKISESENFSESGYFYILIKRKLPLYSYLNGIINEVKCEDEIKIKYLNKHESLERFITIENIKVNNDNEIEEEEEEEENNSKNIEKKNTFKLIPKESLLDGSRLALCNTLYNIGNNHNHNKTISPIDMNWRFGSSKIIKVSCGYKHVLLLTSHGLVYSYGKNKDGELGLNDLEERTTPTLIEYFLSNEKPILIKDISVGSSRLASHSCALTVGGSVYCWGIGNAICKENSKNSLIPNRIISKELEFEEIIRIECGGEFTLCLSRSGKMFSWGKFANGRLGLGSIPTQQNNNNNNRNGENIKYLLFPRRIKGILSNKIIVDISTCLSHCLCIDEDGNVYSWGEGKNGQLGNGNIKKDELSPIKIDYFSENNIKIIKIFCGPNYSCCIDYNGNFYTFGGDGNICIGQGVCKSEKDYCTPKIVKYFKDNEIYIDKISGGDNFLFCRSINGIVYGLGSNKNNQLCLDNIIKETLIPLQVIGTNKNNNGLLMFNKVEYMSSSFDNSVFISQTSLLSRHMRKIFVTTVLELSDYYNPDMLLVINGKNVYCHKIILSMRSKLFYEEIKKKMNLESIMQITLSDVSFNAAVYFLEYIYTDHIHDILDTSTSLPSEIYNLAKKYDLFGLEALMKNLLLNQTEEEEEEENEGKNNKQIVSLNDELSNAVGLDFSSDISFKCENETIYAHQVILRSQSTYFDNLLSKNKERSIENRIVINVPDSKEIMKIFLHYIYTEKLPVGTTNNQIFELLKLLIRYELMILLNNMENYIEINEDNVIDCLELCDNNDQKLILLKTKCLNYIVSNFDSFGDRIEDISKHNKKTILEMFMNLNEEKRMKRNKMLEDKKEIEEKEKEEKEEEKITFFSNMINWKFILFILLILVLYMAVYFRYAESEDNTFSNYVPVINVIGLIFFFVILFTL